MKKIWSILMAAMILCLAVSVPSLAEGTPTLELRPSASSVQPGRGIHRRAGDPQ